MKKTHSAAEIKNHTAAMRRFRMPALPLLTLEGVKKSAPDNELETSTVVDKTEVHEK